MTLTRPWTGSLRPLLLAALCLATLVSYVTLAAAPATAATGPVYDAAGCTAHSIDPNDDGSSDEITLPFPVNFFERTYTDLWVNNNGNVTFDEPQSHYTPYTIDANTPPIIAPFFADVDTRGTGAVTYGNTTFQGFPAFCVDWTGVGYFASHTDLTNTFQLLLVQRPDVGGGAFDIVFNYGRIQWETGDASGGSGGLYGTSAGAGFSNGDGDATHFYQMAGSLQNGAFLDSNPNGLVHRDVGSTIPGRYVFHVRSTADTSGDISRLHRDFPYGHIGYDFGNPGLAPWLRSSGLGVSDVLKHDDMTRTFADWDSVTQGHFLWWTWNRDSHFFQALADVMNGGLCYGLAISGGRFDAALEALHNASARRGDRTWSKPDAFDLPEPGHRGSTKAYDAEFLRLVGDTFVTQVSTEIQGTLQRQHDAYQDPTSGFTAFKNQLVSVMARGKNLYDPSGRTNVSRGNGYAVITLQISGWGGHAVLAYSLDIEDDGTLDIGIWDNNFPNTPLTLKVHPDGTWTYNGQYGGTPFPNSTLSMRNDSAHKQGRLGVIPLYRSTGFHFYPSSADISLGGGSLVDVPAGVSVSATDESGRPVDVEQVLSSGARDAGSIVNLPSGSGDVRVSGTTSPSLDIRGDNVFIAAQSASSSPLTVSGDAKRGAVGISRGRAALSVARGDVLAASTGAAGLTVSAHGAVTVVGSGHPETVTVTSTVDGRTATGVLFSGTRKAGATTTFSTRTVRTTIAKAAPQVLKVKAPHAITVGHPLRIHGTVSTNHGTVILLEHVRHHWKRLASAKVTHHRFRFAARGLTVGRHTFRIKRAAIGAHPATRSGAFRVRVRHG